MATANFLFNDTLYVADNSDDDFLYNDTKENIEHALKQFKDLKHVGVFFDGDSPAKGSTNFGGEVLVECCGTILIDNLVGGESMEFSVRQQIVARDGRYAGFNLDRYYENEYREYFDSLDEIKDNFEEYCETYLDFEGLFDEEDEDEDELAIESYINDTVKPKFERQFREIEKEFDKIYHKLGSDFFDEYGVSARFSNGETHYSKV